MRRCVNCGTEIEDDDLFCPDCGARQPMEKAAEAEEMAAAQGAKPQEAAADEPVAATKQDEEAKDDGTVASREVQFITKLSDDNKGVVIMGVKGAAEETMKTVAKIIVPDTIKGMPVVRIGNNAFREYKSLEYVKLPDSITEIGNGAFLYCTALKSVALPTVIHHINIGDSAFRDCKSLEQVTIPAEANITFGIYCFSGCSSMSPESQSALQRAGYQGEHEKQQAPAIEASKPMPEKQDKKALVVSILDKYIYRINNGYTAYNSKECARRAELMDTVCAKIIGGRGIDILGCIDTTTFGKGKAGLAFTEDALYEKGAGYSMRVKYSQISDNLSVETNSKGKAKKLTFHGCYGGTGLMNDEVHIWPSCYDLFALRDCLLEIKAALGLHKTTTGNAFVDFILKAALNQ